MHPSLNKYAGEITKLWEDEPQRYMNVMAFWERHVINAVYSTEETFDPTHVIYDSSKDNGTGHIIREVELQLKEQVPDKFKHLVHFGCTSEDVMNFAEGVAFKKSVDFLVLYIESVKSCMPKAEHVSVMGMTHGLPATAVQWTDLVDHYKHQLDHMIALSPDEFTVKWGGACGKKTAMKEAIPDVDWDQEVEHFIRSHLYFYEDSRAAKQVSTGTDMVYCLHWVASVCYIIEQIAVDFWHYNSRGIVRYKSKDDGSSAMPHKDNPSPFERAEGLARHAGRILPTMARDRVVTRMQRDLSGMFVARELPEVLSYVEAALKSLSLGLAKTEVDVGTATYEMQCNPQSRSEIEKAKLAANGNVDAYAKTKEQYR